MIENIDIEWKVIPNYERYECSNTGLVRTIKTGRILKQILCEDGYTMVGLHHDNRHNPKALRVHRIVALTWLENPDNKRTVDHIDGNRSNNNLSNLRWASDKEQANNRIYTKPGGFTVSVDQFTKDGEFIRNFTSLNEAALSVGTITCRANISANMNGRNKQYAGYVWKYAPILNLEGEIWKLLIGDCYISNYGRARKKDCLFTLMPHTNGYINIKYNGIHYQLHRIVAQLFLENPDNKPIVNHKDGNKVNNNVNNLEYVTVSENSEHAVNNGFFKKVKKIIHCHENGDIINVYDSAPKAARELKLANPTAILRCCKQEQPKYLGFYFKFLIV